MFEGKAGKNCEECFEITGQFSPTVGPIIRRLLSDTTGHKWLINRRVGRRYFDDLLLLNICVISECSELLSVVRDWSDGQAGIWASSPGHRCELPSPALTTFSIRDWPGPAPSIRRWSAGRWEINNNNIAIISVTASRSVYHGGDYQTVITVFCVKTNNNNLRPLPPLYLPGTLSHDQNRRN